MRSIHKRWSFSCGAVDYERSNRGRAYGEGVLNVSSKTCCIRCVSGTITINRPEKHNAISLATLDDLHGAVDEAADDDSVRVIAITGAGGKAFAADQDLSEVIDRDFKKALEPIVQGLADKLERTLSSTIAAIDGICMGGGLEVALGCDLVSQRHIRALRHRKAS